MALSRIEAQPWLATEAQRCPLVRAAYLGVADALRGFCSETFLVELSETVARGLEETAEEELQVQDRLSLNACEFKDSLYYLVATEVAEKSLNRIEFFWQH